MYPPYENLKSLSLRGAAGDEAISCFYLIACADQIDIGRIPRQAAIDFPAAGRYNSVRKENFRKGVCA